MKVGCTDEHKTIPGNRHLPELVTAGPADLVTTVVVGVTRVPWLIHPWEGLLDQWEQSEVILKDPVAKN